MTALDFATGKGVTVDRVRLALREAFPGEIFNRHISLRDDQIAALAGVGENKKQDRAKAQRQAAPRRNTAADSTVEIGARHITVERSEALQQRATQRTAQTRRRAFPAITLAGIRRQAITWLIAGIVLGHAALIWYDCTVLWATPGIIGGGMAFMIVLATILVSTDMGKGYTQQAGMWTVLVIDIGAWWVHFPTFIRYSSIGIWETRVLCGFICLFSYLALVLFQTYRNEQ